MDLTAAIVLLLLGAAAAPLGVWVLLFRSGYAAESLSHGMLPGLVAASALGAPLLLGALAGAALAAVLIAVAVREERLGADTGIAIATTTLFGAAYLLTEDPHALEALLFGDLDALDGGDVALAAVLAVAAPLALVVAHRALIRSGFEQRAAPPLVLLLLGATVAVSAQAVGALLAVALVIGPAAAALAVTRRLPAALLAAPALAAAAALAGLAAAEPLGVVAPALVALAAVTALPVAVALRRP